jgi:tRNA A22 N-methylase
MATDEPLRRLDALHRLIPESVQSVADIGYDHGHLLCEGAGASQHS